MMTQDCCLEKRSVESKTLSNSENNQTNKKAQTKKVRMVEFFLNLRANILQIF